MLVFSSAEITKSSAPNGAPSQMRWYRSRTGLALAAKLGSRGKTQLRCCQGRRASLLSQRHNVAPLISATRPCEITCCRISSMERRDRGSPRRCGSSQASALTWTTRLGGKAGFTPAARLRLQARHACERKSLAPLAHDLARCIQAGGDDVIGQSLIREKDDLSANHITIR